MNRAAPLVFFSGLVAVVTLVACSAKHEDRPPILTECGSNESCTANGTGSSTTARGDGGTAADSGDIDTGLVDTGVAVDDAGLAFDSGLGLPD